LRSGSLQARQHPFSDAFALELGDGRQKVQLQLRLASQGIANHESPYG